MQAGADGYEEPVELGHEQRRPAAGEGRAPAGACYFTLEHVHGFLSATQVDPPAFRVEEDVVRVAATGQARSHCARLCVEQHESRGAPKGDGEQ
jgi:hypothetical protein